MTDSEYFESPETDGEILPVVDEHDNVIDHQTRREIHLCGLWHRAIHVVFVDEHGRIILQKRSMKKDHYPGWWDLSVGGHVGPDEDYDTAAVREMREEMGVEGCEPVFAVKLHPSPENGWEFIAVYGCRIRGEVHPDPDEISDVRRVDPEEYFARASPRSSDLEWRVTPTSLASIRAWWNAGAPA